MKASSIKYIQVALFIMCNLYVSSVFAQYRTEHEIDSIGQSFIAKMQKVTDNGNLTYRLALKSSEVITDSVLSTERFFVYNLEDKNITDKYKGFFIVSTDRNAPAVIGYSETSTFDKTNIPPALKYWLSTFCRNDISSTRQDMQPLTDGETKGVAPLLGETQWGQDKPFNNDCPTNGNKHCLTGCVATAMAQVMKYYEYPNCGHGKIKYTTNTNRITIEKDLEEYPFSWSKMKSNYSNGYTGDEAFAVATLMSCCGASVSMDYDVEASGAYQYDLLFAYLNYFDYDKDAAFMMRNYCTEKDWHSLLTKELDAGRPVNYAGQSRKDGGHSFVVDGYRSSTSTKYPYYHINWGWQGQCDGYYQIAELRPTENGQYATEDGFSETQQMLIGIKPNDNIDENKNVICTSKLELPRNDLYSGESATLSIAEIYNFSLEAFNGNLVAVLVDSINEETQIGSMSLSANYMNTTSDQVIRISIPNTTATGSYTLELRSIKNGSDTVNKVYSASYPIVSINHASTPTFTSKLGAAELEATKNEADDKQICINAYIITNLSEEPFSGQLQMTITDSDYNPLASFGSCMTLDNLEYLDFLSDPISLLGYIPNDISDGEYYLCLSSKHTNEGEWNLVCYYDDIFEQAEENVLSLPMNVEDNVVTIGNQTYKKVDDTGINEIPITLNAEIVNGGIIVKSNGKAEPVRIYDLKGSLVARRNIAPNGTATIKLPKGCYIISTNGESLKIAI